MYKVTESCQYISNRICQTRYLCDNVELTRGIMEGFVEKRTDQMQREVINNFTITCERMVRK